jgi:hypothetical protein
MPHPKGTSRTGGLSRKFVNKKISLFISLKDRPPHSGGGGSWEPPPKVVVMVVVVVGFHRHATYA